MATVAQKSGIFSRFKKIASLTGNTWEALQCVRLYQKAPESACLTFKVLTLARADLLLEFDPQIPSYSGEPLIEVHYTTQGIWTRCLRPHALREITGGANDHQKAAQTNRQRDGWAGGYIRLDGPHWCPSDPSGGINAPRRWIPTLEININ